MTDDDRDLLVRLPDLQSGTDLATIRVRRAARDHLAAWDASQRLMAVHEGGHVAAAAALGIATRVVDIEGRHFGFTETVGPEADTELPWETSRRMLDRVVVSMAGAAAERAVLGEHTSGAAMDFDHAVRHATAWLAAGFGGPTIFIGEGGLPFGYLTEDVRSTTLARVQSVVDEAKDRAADLMVEHRDGLLHIASEIYEHRRLTDERLADVLRAAGFHGPSRTP